MKSNKPQKGGRYHQGYFHPRHPEKYAGDATQIIYRSGLEKRFFKFFDEEPNVVKYASEEFFIPYMKPGDNKKPHRYFVDIIFQMKSGERVIAEIKPFSQCQEPVKPKSNNRKAALRYMEELITWEINQAKWEAAKIFCKERGITFMVLTERNLPKSNR